MADAAGAEAAPSDAPAWDAALAQQASAALALPLAPQPVSVAVGDVVPPAPEEEERQPPVIQVRFRGPVVPDYFATVASVSRVDIRPFYSCALDAVCGVPSRLCLEIRLLKIRRW